MMDPLRVPSLTALRAFEAIGRRGGIRKAAEALSVSHSIVSRHLRYLERDVGVTLFDRERGGLTAAGERYFERLSRAFAEIGSATAELHAHRSAPLVIGCAPGLALHWLTARLSGFSRRSSAPVVELRALDVAPDLVANKVDADIRYIREGDQVSRSVRTVELARPNVFPVGAPQLVKALRHRVRTAADFVNLPLIEEGDAFEWRHWLAAQGVDAGPIVPVAFYGHSHLALAAARAGQGIALGNHYLIDEDRMAGRLCPLEPSEGALAPVALGSYTFRTHRSLWSNPRLVRFRTWLIEEFARDPAP